MLPTASIGAAIFPDSGKDSDALLSAADAALYAVKENGRNGVMVHGAELTRRAANRTKLEEQVRQAVESKQFCLRYQPQLSLTDDFVGAEALLRWENSSGELIEAGEFLRVLEDSGQLTELGPWILETACQQLRQWRNAGHRVDRVAINLSARQVISRDFVGRLRRATRQAELSCSDIELELTETTLLRDSESVLTVLHQLALYGYRLALDDFGTGYCSLAHLTRFPIHTLKIDNCFTRTLVTDGKTLNLVAGIIHLAKRVGLEVVAEGVETSEQLELLRAEQCRLVQGYLLGGAMTPDEFVAEAQRGWWESVLAANDTQPASRLVSHRVSRARDSNLPQLRTRER